VAAIDPALVKAPVCVLRDPAIEDIEVRRRALLFCCTLLLLRSCATPQARAVRCALRARCSAVHLCCPAAELVIPA
jgi:hypothetical protein